MGYTSHSVVASQQMGWSTAGAPHSHTEWGSDLGRGAPWPVVASRFHFHATNHAPRRVLARSGSPAHTARVSCTDELTHWLTFVPPRRFLERWCLLRGATCLVAVGRATTVGRAMRLATYTNAAVKARLVHTKTASRIGVTMPIQKHSASTVGPLLSPMYYGCGHTQSLASLPPQSD